MSKELKVEFNLADYLSEYEMKNLAREVFRDHVSKHMRYEDDVKRILTNSAYEIVSNILEDRLGMNLESHLEDKCMKIINDENSVRFELFREYDGKKGIGLVLLERIVTEKLQDKLEKVAENIIKNIKLDTKKFEKLITEKVAEKVANSLK